MKKIYSRLKLNWFDDCCRAGERILTVALALLAFYAVLKVFGAWTFLMLLGVLHLYTRPKNRGIEHARFFKHNGYSFKVWQGFSGRWYWRSADWPFVEQRSSKSRYKVQYRENGATEVIDAYISLNYLPRRDEPPSENELKKQKAYQDFCEWAIEADLDVYPKIKKMKVELNHWRYGDSKGLF